MSRDKEAGWWMDDGQGDGGGLGWRRPNPGKSRRGNGKWNMEYGKGMQVGGSRLSWPPPALSRAFPFPLPAPLPVGSMENEDTVSARFVYGFDLGDNRRCALAPPLCGGDAWVNILLLHGQALAVKNLEVEQKVPRGCEINRSGPRERGLGRMARRERGASPQARPPTFPAAPVPGILFLNL